jgi:diguanylate cyclase (GGDEF)-like protein
MLSLSTPDLSRASFSRFRTPTFHLESTVRELSLYQFQVESHRLGKEIAEAFDRNPLLPGVVLLDNGQFEGMISRRHFFEHLRRPYGLELFFKRPVKSLYRFAHSDVLCLPSSMTIVMAAQAVLHRSPHLLYEPLVVEMAPNDYRLIDVHQLLLAHAQIHQLATELLNNLYQQLETANRELKRQASLDGLTQLANRRKFDEYLQQEWWRMTRERQPLALILCDIDCFRSYNDTYGHQAGDCCLQTVAQTLRHGVRRSTDLMARYGGEEFAAILPNTDLDGAFAVAQQLRSRVKALDITHGGCVPPGVVTLSVGVASQVPSSASSPEDLIAAADGALYRAKERGRDRVVVCDECYDLARDA